MSRIMYDAVSWENIPDNAEMVAGYIDGPASQWSAEAWARFPHAVKVRITVNPADNEGDVLDVEQGDANPADAPGWIRRRHAAGAPFVTIYCNRSTLPAVQACRPGHRVQPVDLHPGRYPAGTGRGRGPVSGRPARAVRHVGRARRLVASRGWAGSRPARTR